MKTFSRESWEEAQASWSGFSDEWRDTRHAMAMRGVIFAPSGTEFDSWEDDSPSQRAMLIRAIREQPTLLRRCILRARSWSDVIASLMTARDDWRAEQRERELEAARRRVEENPSPRSAPQSIASILLRVADSAGVGVVAREADEEREQERLERMVAGAAS